MLIVERNNRSVFKVARGNDRKLRQRVVAMAYERTTDLVAVDLHGLRFLVKLANTEIEDLRGHQFTDFAGMMGLQ